MKMAHHLNVRREYDSITLLITREVSTSPNYIFKKHSDDLPITSIEHFFAETISQGKTQFSKYLHQIRNKILKKSKQTTTFWKQEKEKENSGCSNTFHISKTQLFVF